MFSPRAGGGLYANSYLFYSMMTSGGGEAKKLKGARRRKWGKWVSEIRVPGTQERLWLGTYSTPQAAAVAHDVASYSLRGPSSVDSLNFPLMLPAPSVRAGMSPKSIQKAASDAGMAVDAQLIRRSSSSSPENDLQASDQAAAGAALSSSRTGMEITELWEELDCGDNCGKWEENASRPEGEGCLSISIEDYI